MIFDRPQHYLITPEPTQITHFLSELDSSLSQGIKLVQLRSKNLQPDSYVQLAQNVLTVCRAHGTQLILNGPVLDLHEVNADGIQLDSRRLMQTSARFLPANKLLAASCHTLEELRHAQNIGVDFVTLSPVQATKTHPDAEPMGWQNFAQLRQSVQLPVYALGGMLPADLDVARSYGACGVAGIRGLWAGQV